MERPQRRRLTEDARASALVVAAFVLSGLAYSLLWPELRHGVAGWATPGDLWATYRDAQWITWGGFGTLYSAGAGLVALPGLPLLLAPVALACSAMGLRGGFPYAIPYPGAWLVVGPVALLLGASLVPASIALARWLGVPARRRAVLGLVVAVLTWPAVVLWGHPEDAVALSLVCWALGALFARRPVRGAWLLGAAIAMQPLASIAAPVLAGLAWRLGESPAGAGAAGEGAAGGPPGGTGVRAAQVTAGGKVARRGARHAGIRSAAALVARASVVPVTLGALLLGAAPHATLRALGDQPNYPTVDWPTPWLALAPRLGHGAIAAGPERLVSVVGAVCIGVWVGLRPRRPAEAAWALALAFALRPLLEAVMVPYYVLPAAVMASVAAASPLPHGSGPAGPAPRWLAWLAAVGCSAFAFCRIGPWPFLLGLALLLGAMLAAAKPQGLLSSQPVVSHRALERSWTEP